ncbi:MAG TPA: hypothetical protein HA257_09485 [Candidatus Methanoperedenaceae archaeon]|nr:hypothetical protein [Candidatus Methanoperedenaceae archaeon]
MSGKQHVLNYLLLSGAGALLLLAAAIVHASGKTIGSFDRAAVGGAFILCCAYGVYAAIRPGQGTVKDRGHRHSQTKVDGHHPDCEHFRSHVVRIGHRTMCSGCLGLAAGAVVSAVLMLLYIAPAWELSVDAPQFLLPAGLGLVALNFVETALPGKNGYVHMLSNILLVTGFLSYTVGILQLTGSAAYGFFGIMLSFLWLDTRVVLSDQRHVYICQGCSETCKMFPD